VRCQEQAILQVLIPTSQNATCLPWERFQDTRHSQKGISFIYPAFRIGAGFLEGSHIQKEDSGMELLLAGFPFYEVSKRDNKHDDDDDEKQ
jgi:hypothetical protein